MIERGLRGVRLVVCDRCAGLVSTVNSMLSDARYQRCMVHFMRNVLSKTPPSHREWRPRPQGIFAMESRKAALAKAEAVATEMESRKLKAAANCLREGIGETTTYLLPRVPRRAPQEDPHEQHDRTAQPRDQTSHPRCGRLPRRQERAHAPSAPASGTPPPANGPRVATSICPASMTTSWKRTDNRAMDGRNHICAHFRTTRWCSD